MKKVIESFFLSFLFRIAMWFRYRIEVQGLDKLTPETLNKPGGILFLPNHPTVFIDPVCVTMAILPKYSIRPLIVEYMYYTPIINWLMRKLNALPIPNFAESSNSYKRKKSEQAIQEVVKGLRQKDNFLIFPAGRVKHTAYEALDGASAVHRIVQEAPETNIVLVRVKGAWGSSFSQALTGKNPSIFRTILRGMLIVLQNLIFFTPRRKIIIEFEPAEKDFPWKAGRMEFNKYLEQWYNKPDGLTPQTGAYPGDSLVLVSYSMWVEKLPKVWEPKSLEERQIEIKNIPMDIQKKVKDKIAELLSINADTVSPNQSLTTDLGMDSLDTAEIAAFLQDQYDINNVSPNDLTTVGRIMGLASRQLETEGVAEEAIKNLSQWFQTRPHTQVRIAEGETIPEVFLNSCQRLGNQVACADMRSGIVTYKQLKLRTLLLADYIKKLPGKYIGILLPASTAASATILACQLAGKVPLMINWTVGPRHLQAVVELSKVQVVLTSWSFIDRLQNVDFNGVDDLMVMLEDVRRNFSLTDKLKAFYRSTLGTKSILKAFDADKLTKDNEAVMLFTSGTESLPKGVPLTFNNILSNQRATLESFPIYADDILLGILPPFHSFGFTISSILGLLAGIRIAFSPDPTDSKRLAQAFAQWKATMIIGAPTFVKGFIKAVDPKHLTTMRLCITGAEKAPPELLHALDQLGYGKCRYEGYGVTECSPVLTFTPQGKPPRGVGIPLSNVELCIVDLNTHEVLPQGDQGLILASGPNVFSGYLNPGLASPFIMINGYQWYNTGDLGFIDTEGNLNISGRLKRFIKVGGEMVSLTAVENTIAHMALNAGIAQKEEGPILAISGKEFPGEKPKMALFVKFPITVEEANKALKEAGFSNLVKINNVIQLAEIPLMGTGKVNYRKLEETYPL